MDGWKIQQNPFGMVTFQGLPMLNFWGVSPKQLVAGFSIGSLHHYFGKTTMPEAEDLGNVAMPHNEVPQG